MLGRHTHDCHLREWKHYRGGKCGQCWVDPNQAGRFFKLQLYLGSVQGEREVSLNIASPFVVEDRLYFVADPSSTELEGTGFYAQDNCKRWEKGQEHMFPSAHSKVRNKPGFKMLRLNSSFSTLSLIRTSC